MGPGLSERQEECLRMTAFLTDKEIATRLGLSEATVKKHVHEACRRLGVNRRKAALAILERNVPEPTKDPIGAPSATASAPAAVTEFKYVVAEQAPAPLDVGGPGNRAGRVQSVGPRQSPAHLSYARPGGGRPAGESARTAEAGPERGMGDGPDGQAERRLGYRPPPRNRGLRLLIIAVMVVVCALVVKSVADVVLDYFYQAEAIGVALNPG